MSDLVIIGAGIAGLSAAWELVQRGLRPVLVEKEPRAGGMIRTDRVEDFVIDAGPDALLVQKPAAIALCRELSLGDRLLPTLTPRTAYVLRRGRLVPLPEASVLGIPTRIGPLVTTPLFSWAGKARMALDLVIAPRRDGADESIAAFVRRRLGEEAVTYLAEPLLAGIHAGDVNRLSMQAAFPRLVEAERSQGSVIRALSSIGTPPGTSTQGAFLSLPGGIEELVNAIVTRLPGGTLRTSAGVTAIEGTGPYAVHFASGERLEARVVIVAAPAWVASAMLAPLDAEIARLASQVRYMSSATVAIGVHREQVRHPLQGSGFVVPRPERKALMAASFVSSKWPHRAPQGFALLRGFVGGAYDQGVLEQSDSRIVDAVFAELSSLLGISGTPQLARVYRWPRASAQHDVGHLERMAEIDRRLASFPGLFVTGSGFRGTGIPDCVADGRATAIRAAAFLS